MAKKKKPILRIEINPYRDTRPYVLWRRVSTKKQGESGLGLEAQVEIAKSFMQRDPVAMFTDVVSGTDLRGCKDLKKAIEYCKENGCVLVIAKTDRWRNTEEALWLLREIGEGNLIFCDLPECNRYMLVNLVEMWTRQAEMIRFNTTKALEVRQSQIERDGGFMSRAGNWCTHLGNAKGTDTSKASAAAARKSALEAFEWRQNNAGYKWVRIQVRKRRLQKDILREFNEFHDAGMEGFCTRTGKRMNVCTLSEWIQEIRREI